MNDILDFIGDSILLLKMHIAGEKSRTQNEIVLGEQDLVLVELLIKDRFNELSQKAHLEGRQIPEIEQQFLRTLEESLVEFLEGRFRESASLHMEEIDNFLAKCLSDFTIIQEVFKEYRRRLCPIIDIEPDTGEIDNIKKIGIPTKDSVHIASAMEHALSHKLSAVFVSVDYRTILCYQEELYQKLAIQVCDPIYVYQHLKNQEAFKSLVLSRSRNRQSAITAWQPPSST